MKIVNDRKHIKSRVSNKWLVTGLTLLLIAAIVGTLTPGAVALPTATSFGVEDAEGYKDTHVLIPVNVTNVQNGPVPCMIFNIVYDNSVINLEGVQKGTLTSDWRTPVYGNLDWGSRITVFYEPIDEHAIPNGASGSVVLLNFSVIGEPGDMSRLNFSDIQLAEDAPYFQIGTAPAKNGTFSLLPPALVQQTQIGQKRWDDRVLGTSAVNTKNSQIWGAENNRVTATHGLKSPGRLSVRYKA
ncbi:MAG: cohesin domain-containing protein [Euryarchaeota archaeon]|nr:cohesin domain-containing protein [Euryarchaeota archaeon]